MRIAPHRSRPSRAPAAASYVPGVAALTPFFSSAAGAAQIFCYASSLDAYPWEVMR